MSEMRTEGLIAEARALLPWADRMAEGASLVLNDLIEYAEQSTASIEQAPHDPDCEAEFWSSRGYTPKPCDCWKSTAPALVLARRDARVLREEADRFEKYVADGGPVGSGPEEWLRRRATQREREAQ